MAGFTIFTESKADVKFLTDFIHGRFEREPTNDFVTLSSWSGYKAGGNILDAIQQNHDNGNRTVLILDADTDFAERQNEIQNDFEGYNIPIQLFLFPNNSYVGSLEHLLCEVAVDRQLMKCFEGYEACIAGYESPVTKSKVFAYLDALLPEVNKKNDRKDLIQKKNRNYRNPAHWNLHHEYLNPLHNFLQQFFL